MSTGFQNCYTIPHQQKNPAAVTNESFLDFEIPDTPIFASKMESEELNNDLQSFHTWSMSDIHSITMSTAPKENKIKAYRQWSKTYDEDVLGSKYVACDVAAEKLSHVIRSDSTFRSLDNVNVFDAGCGTGLCAVSFQKVAEEFRLPYRLTGVDFSEEMLREASHKNLYTELHCADMNRSLPIEPGSQHLVMSIGVFLEGHCGPEALGNILTCLAIGGYAVISIRLKHYATLRKNFWE